MQQGPGPGAKAHEEGLVETKLLPYAANVIAGCGVTGENRCGVARCEVKQRENDKRNDRHNDDGRKQTT